MRVISQSQPCLFYFPGSWLNFKTNFKWSIMITRQTNLLSHNTTRRLMTNKPMIPPPVLSPLPTRRRQHSVAVSHTSPPIPAATVNHGPRVASRMSEGRRKGGRQTSRGTRTAPPGPRGAAHRPGTRHRSSTTDSNWLIWLSGTA